MCYIHLLYFFLNGKREIWAVAENLKEARLADFNCVDPHPQVRMCVPGEYMYLQIKNQTEKVEDTLTNNLSHNRNHFYLEGFHLARFLRVQTVIQEKHGGGSVRQLVMLHLQWGNSDACSEILMSLHVCRVQNKIVSFKLNYLLAEGTGILESTFQVYSLLDPSRWALKSSWSMPLFLPAL